MRHALHASQGGLLDKLSARVRVFVIAQLQVLPARTGIANASLHSCQSSTLLYLPARTTSSSPAACALLDCAPLFSPYPTPAPLGAHAVSTFHLYHLIFVRFHLSTRAYSSLCNASQLALALSASESNTARPHLAHSFTFIHSGLEARMGRKSCITDLLDDPHAPVSGARQAPSLRACLWR